MPSSRILKGVVGGIAGSFASRNNDLDGYWALGQLKSLSQNLDTRSFELTLLPAETQDESIIQEVSVQYRALLNRLLQSVGFDIARILRAKIYIRFLSEGRADDRFDDVFDCEPVSILVAIQTLNGKVFSQESFTRCRPHNASIEKRRLESSWGVS